MKWLKLMPNYFSNATVIIMLFIATLSILVDGKSYKKRGYSKEFKIINILSYSYIVLGVFVFVLLKIVK